MSIDLTWPMASDGAGAVSFTAAKWRTLLTNLFAEGILGAGSFAVSERALGANMTLDIAAGAGVLEGDDVAGQGHYLIEASETLSAVTVPTADGTHPRVDLVGIQLRDPSAGGAAGRDSVFAVVSGDAAADPAAPSVPDSFLPLASVLVPAGAVSISDADITDARQFSRLVHAVVSTDQTVDGSITSPKLAAGSVTAEALAFDEGSLDGGKIRFAKQGRIVSVWTTARSGGGLLPEGFRPAAQVETDGLGAADGDPNALAARPVSIDTAGNISPTYTLGSDGLVFSVSFVTP